MKSIDFFCLLIINNENVFERRDGAPQNNNTKTS